MDVCGNIVCCEDGGSGGTVCCVGIGCGIGGDCGDGCGDGGGDEGVRGEIVGSDDKSKKSTTAQ